MSLRKSIVIVGGACGGSSAAARARQANEHARITIIEQALFLSWSQFGLRKQLACQESFLKDKLIDLDRMFTQRFNVDIRPDTRAVGLDVEARCLFVERDGHKERLGYDSVVFAGGGISKRLDVDGLCGPRVIDFRNYEDLAAIRSAIVSGARSAVVVGCGVHGVDAALGLKAAGLEVTILEHKMRIMPRFSLQFAQAMVKQLYAQGIVIRLGTKIIAADCLADGAFNLVLSRGDAMMADIVVMAIGVLPDTALLENSGAAVDVDGLVRVDDHLRTTLPHIYACGSLVSVPCIDIAHRRWVKEPAIIHRTAQIAGFNAASDEAHQLDAIKPVSGSLMLAIGETSFARTGLLDHEARLQFGDDNLLFTTVYGRAARSFDQSEMCVKLMVDRKSRRIVGGEVYGNTGVDRCIDLLAVAVLEGFTPDRLIDVDLAYLADENPAFDPMKDAALRARMGLVDKAHIMSAETLAMWLKSNRDFRLVDVGEAPKLSGLAESKAIHLPLEMLRSRMGELLADKDFPIVLYSKSGHRSYLAQQALVQCGMTNVYHLDGGLATWDLLIAKE